MEAVREILEAEGTSVEEMDINESYIYESEVYEDLAVEKVREDVVSVEQFYTKRMERYSDPEVRFDVSDPENWVPIEYSQEHPPVYDRDEDGLAVEDFLRTWDKNLKQQFPADEVAGGENQ